MRRLLSALIVAAGSAAVLAVPVVARPVDQAHAVVPHVYDVAVPAAPVALASARGHALAAATRLHTRFDLVGAQWDAGTYDVGTTALEVRVHGADGWSGWTGLGAEDGGADGDSPDALRAARVHVGMQTASPLWVGRSDGAQVRVVASAHNNASAPGVVAPASAPAGLRLVLVDGGTSAADADPKPAAVLGGDVANAATPEPTIYTRADWGADESLRKDACPDGPDYAPTIKMGFIHHTDNANSYSKSQVPAIIRSIYAYHVRSNGWCDVGYNFLIDRFGRIWEGRYGGIAKAVVGAHTGGFNYESFGAGLIGTFNSVKPSAAMQTAVEQLFAWRLGSYYLDPRGESVLTAAAFSGSRHRTGSNVKFNTVSGHRDADFTDCPGNAAYALLPHIRSLIASDMGAGFVAPHVSSRSAKMASGAITAVAHVIGNQSWTLTVTDADGQPVDTLQGSASRTSAVSAKWPLTNSTGSPVLPGSYRLTLTGAAGSLSALSWSTTVTIRPPVDLVVPTQSTLNASVVPHGTGINGHSVAVTVSSGGTTRKVGTFKVASNGSWSAPSTAAVTASSDLAWSAVDTSVTGYARKRTTRVGPAITSPTSTSYVTAGSSLAAQGTALPASGATVTLWTQPTSATHPVQGSAAPVGTDGSWSLSFTPSTATRYWVSDSRGLKSRTLLAYAVSAPSAHAPSHGYAARAVTVRGNAGNAPVAVTLSARQPGAGWATVSTVQAATNGAFSARLPLADSAGSSTRWRVSTNYGSPVTGTVRIDPVFVPTVTGPRRSAWNAVHALSGTAVPGDRVTIWTAPVGTTSWTKQGGVRAASDKSWSFPLTFTADTAWRVTSPSGTSTTGKTVVVPTLSAPRSSTSGARVVLSGRAIPKKSLIVFRQSSDADTWTQVHTLTVAADGTWSWTLRPHRTMTFRVKSHGQYSAPVTINVQ